MRTAFEGMHLNRVLGRFGLAKLEDPAALVPQLASLVSDHDAFVRLIATVGGQERQDMYTAMTPHLRFKAHPLDWYIAEAGRRAEAQRLPTIDTETKLETAYRPQQISTEPFTGDELVLGDSFCVIHSCPEPCPYCPKGSNGTPTTPNHKAITKIVHESLVSHRLNLVCRKCTFGESFPASAERKQDAIEAAREKGWVYDPTEKFEMCPKCSELYSV